MDFAAFAGFDALADRAGLDARATFASIALEVVRALFVNFAMVIVRPALVTLIARAARAALEALAFVAFAFFVILDAAFADFAEIFADFFADLLAVFEDPADFVDFAAAPRAALTPRFVTLVALRFFGTAAPESLPPAAAPSNEPCGKPQPISNCSAMRR